MLDTNGGGTVAETPTERYALVPDRIWDGVSDRSTANASVVVEGSLIRSVVPTNELPADLRQVALEGCTLIPGLIDAHTHYSPIMGPALLAAGVTTIRDVGNDLEWIIGQRARHRSDPSLGPTIFCCGHLLDGPEAYWKRMGKAHADPKAVRESVRRHASAGVDAIKLYTGLDLELLTAAVDESHRRGLFVLAHLGATKAEEAALAGVNEIEHLSGCSVASRQATEEEDDQLIDVLLRHEVVLDPTLVVWDRLGRIMEHSFLHDQRRKWVHPTHLRVWDYYESRSRPPVQRLGPQLAIPHNKRFVRRAHERGVTIALGTDTPFPHLVPGFSVHDELAMYVDAGLSPVDALRSATSVNAQVLGAESAVGRIAPEMVADLVAVNGNPLERIDDIGNVAKVVHAGRVFDSASLLKTVQPTFGQQLDDTIAMELLDHTKEPDGSPT